MMPSKWLAAVVLAVLATSIGGACKKRSSTLDMSVPTKPVPEDKDESGWPLYRIEEEKFAISLPPEWRQIDMNPAKFEASFGQALKNNPQLNEMVGGLRQQILSGIKFFGFDQSSVKTGFATNVNVLHIRYPRECTLDEMVEINMEQLNALEMVAKPVLHERTNIAAGEAERFRYTMVMKDPRGKAQKIDSTQFGYIKGNDCFFITMVTFPESSKKYEPTFFKIGQSFRLTQ